MSCCAALANVRVVSSVYWKLPVPAVQLASAGTVAGAPLLVVWIGGAAAAACCGAAPATAMDAMSAAPANIPRARVRFAIERLLVGWLLAVPVN